MSSLAMALLLVSLCGLFAWSAQRRFALLTIGAPTWESRTDRLFDRLRAVWVFALVQKKMRYYLLAGLAHNLIFVGFSVLTLRTLMLWGRGFDPSFNLWVLGLDAPLGQVYAFLKDCFAILVLLGIAVFVYYRVINPQKRMTLSGEGLLILALIATMMVSDLLYDGASQVINVRYAEFCAATPGADLCRAARTIVAPLPAPAKSLEYHFFPEPGG
ncbi:MAG TPA: (Fe-S)-binding protein, partial [Polyangiaceae bacterium]|nr:(Fe-S)-binding protein [Polyangiaceae bacterium]